MTDKTIKFKDGGECPAARGAYYGGEVRTINGRVAKDLVDRGVAKYVTPSKVNRKD